MKDFNEIMSHVLAIDKADDNKAISFYERKKNLEALACKVADELIAGRPVPAFDQAESVTRIDGLLRQLANELVSQHDMAIAHRTHLAERLEADGGENGVKAAAILRGMDAAVAPKTTHLAVRAGYECEPFWIDAGKLSEVDLAKLQEVMGQPGAKVDIFRHGLPPYTYFAGPSVAKSAEEDQRLKRTAAKFGGVLRPTSECGIISDDAGTATYTMVGEVNEGGHIEWRAGVDVQGLLSDRSQRYFAQEAKRRASSLAETTRKRIAAATMRGRAYGFRRARAEALAAVVSEAMKLDIADRGPLNRAADAIFSMKEEGAE